MGLYLISYDYHRERDYRRLYKKLADWRAAKLLESFWLAQLPGPARAIRDELKTVGDNDDAFAVIELQADSEWAVTARTFTAGTDWLERHLRP